MNVKNIANASLEELLKERLELLIKLSHGSTRRIFLRLKLNNQVESDLLVLKGTDSDDLTLYLMETVLQMPSIEITNAIQNIAPLIFDHVTDWTFLYDKLCELSSTVPLASVRVCIKQWVFNARKANCCLDETSTSLLFSFPSDMNVLRELLEWLDRQCP